MRDLQRRNVLVGFSAMTLAACVSPGPQSGAAPSGKRSFAVPRGACDSHLHIYDPRFPYLPDARLKPPPATVADYRTLQGVMGTSRCVVVQPSTYGTDNRCTLDALDQFGEAARGVIMCRADISTSELKRLHEAGVRGVRISGSNFIAQDEVAPFAARLADLGWHLQFSLSPDVYVELGDLLLGLPVNIVLDHFGRVAMPEDGTSAHYMMMRRLLDSGHAWIKLSSPYTSSRSGPPDYADVGVLARDFIAQAPQRMLWATNWPFPDVPGPRPSSLHMLNLLADWAPDAAMRNRILVENPEALYDFSPKRRPRSI